MAKINARPLTKRIVNFVRGNLESRGPGDLKAQAIEARLVGEDRNTFEVLGQKLTRPGVVELVCQRLSEGYSLPDTFRLKGMPSMRTFMGWVRTNTPYRRAYEEALEVRGIVLAEQALACSTGINDKEDVPAAKLQVDTLKWLASKENKRYAEKQIVEETVTIQNESEEQLRSRLSAILERNPTIANLMPKQLLSNCSAIAENEAPE